jgi:hypothetical protein
MTLCDLSKTALHEPGWRANERQLPFFGYYKIRRANDQPPSTGVVAPVLHHV